MRPVNSVTISGNLGHDAELRTTKTGKNVVSFSVCVNAYSKRGDEWSTKPNWVPVVWWGDEAADAVPRLTKGRTVVVVGRLNQNEWTANGEKRSRLEIVADSVHPVDKAPKAEEQPAVWDEDIPF